MQWPYTQKHHHHQRGNYLPGEHNGSWNWSCVTINHLSFFPCTLFHSSSKTLLNQKFPTSDRHALDLSNRLRSATLSLADLQMQLRCRSCTLWAISSVTSKKICIFILRLYTLIKYHKIKPVTLNIILFSWIPYTKFLSLYVVLSHFWFVSWRQHTLVLFFLDFTPFLSILAFFELDTEDTVRPTYSTFEPLNPIQMHDISILGWECSLWTFRKGDCKVHFVFISSPLEKDELKDELSYERPKLGQRAITQTACKCDWDYVHDIKENSEFLKIHTIHI